MDKLDLLVLVVGIVFELIVGLILYLIAGFKLKKFDLMAYGLSAMLAALAIGFITNIISSDFEGLGYRAALTIAEALCLFGYRKFKKEDK
jgi:hypothetical protein